MKTSNLIVNCLLIIQIASLSVSAANDKRPNILLIMSDDHGSQTLSCYDSKINVTPNMDRLAHEGMQFNHCFCTNSLCAPSRATILTGKYGHKNGIKGNEQKAFDGSQQTLPKLMQAAGYQSAIVGKWHLKSAPTGFDYWHVLPGQGIYHNPEFIIMGKRTHKQGYVTDIITDESIAWIEQRDKDQPFFLMCHFKAPHASHDFDDKHAHLYNEDLPEPSTLLDDYDTRNSAAHVDGEFFRLENMYKYDLREKPPAHLTGLALRKWYFQKFFKGYLKVIASIDDNIGRLLTFLDKKHLTENTIVIYTTDNGFFIGDHGWYNKMWMYEESLHLPLVIRYPQEIKPGSTSDAFVMNLDFAPTLLDYANIPIPDDIQGRSFWSILNGRHSGNFRDAVYYHYYKQYGVPGLYGIRTQQHKLIYYYSLDEWELFDLQADPRELNNVYTQATYQKTITDLKLQLKTLRTHYEDTDYAF